MTRNEFTEMKQKLGLAIGTECECKYYPMSDSSRMIQTVEKEQAMECPYCKTEYGYDVIMASFNG